MRHRKTGRKLGRNQSARKAMFRNMVTSLMEHGQIRTTEAKAKELRRYAEKVITIAKRAPNDAAIAAMSGDDEARAKAARVHAIRRARRWVNNAGVLGHLFSELAPRYADRNGGYTRVIKAGFRPGDNASMAIIELVQDGDAAVAATSDDAPVVVDDATDAAASTGEE